LELTGSGIRKFKNSWDCRARNISQCQDSNPWPKLSLNLRQCIP